MRKTSHKSQRINGEVQKELSRIIRMELKDPRINPMTSVTDVMVTQDLKYCKALEIPVTVSPAAMQNLVQRR